MAVKSERDVYAAILAHIRQQGGDPSEWYVGITDDVNRRLPEHGVPSQNHWYIVQECISADSARRVEAALLQQGCEGGEGGGDDSSNWVYAYLMTEATDP